MADKAVKIKKLPKSLVEFELVVTPEALEKYKPEALKRIGQNAKIDGFRKGHVPPSVIEEKYGKEYVNGMTIDVALPPLYTEAVKANKIDVIGQPKVEQIKEDPITFKVTAPVLPEVKIGDYKKIKIKKETVKVTKKDVDEILDQINQRHAKYNIVDRAAKMGDRAEISFRGGMQKGVYEDKFTSKHHPLILGSKSFIPGFEEEVVGMKKGEKKEFEITFPKDYHAKDLQGKKVIFEVEIHEVEEMIPPVIDEKFIKEVTGQDMSKDDFMKDIEKNLKDKKEQDANRAREDKLMDELIKMTKVEIPDVLLEEEKKSLVKDMKNRLAQRKIDFDMYLKSTNKTEEDLYKEYEEQAVRTITMRFGIRKVMEKEKIEADEAAIQKEIDQILVYVPENERSKFTKLYKKGSERYHQMESKVKVDKVVEMLLAQ